jgi:uncharacterized membrane protein
MDPAAFLPHFATAGPTTGAVLFPTELASVLLLGAAAYTSVKRGGPASSLWSLATSGMVGTVVLLPVYFARANAAMLAPDFPVHAVPRELTAWHRWNWVRTGLALTATALSCIALAVNGDETVALTK